MEQLIALANDVGLYAEELDPAHQRAAGQHPPGTGAPRAHQRRRLDRQGGRRMSVWGALAGGFVGTLVLTTALRTANELGLTRVDLPFLLGTAVTRDRARAKALGYLLHLWPGRRSRSSTTRSSPRSTRAAGCSARCFGLLHGIVSATALVNILLPAVHPRMGSALSAADSSPLLEPPGFLHAQLRPRHPDRHPARPHRLRRDRRRLRLDRRLTTRIATSRRRGPRQRRALKRPLEPLPLDQASQSDSVRPDRTRQPMPESRASGHGRRMTRRSRTTSAMHCRSRWSPRR